MSVSVVLRKAYRLVRRRRDAWDHLVDTTDVETLRDAPQLDAAGRRRLFKRNITLVELEPHAYCNRTCSFCPNSTIDRLSVKTLIAPEVFDAVLRDLASIDYAGVLRLARYSEPMAHEHIYDLVSRARRMLPRAEIDIVTNGDYLDPDALQRLRIAGLSVLRISVYMRRGVAWTAAAAREEIERVGRRIGVAPRWTDATPSTVGAVFPYAGLRIVTFSHNFDETGYDRGGLVEKLTDRGYVRRSPCFLVVSNFTVDFNGKVMPCCNLRSDHPAHEGFVIGDLAGGAANIFDVYAGRLATEWRRSLAVVGDKADPCATCKQKTLDGPALASLAVRLAPKLSAAGIVPGT